MSSSIMNLTGNLTYPRTYVRMHAWTWSVSCMHWTDNYISVLQYWTHHNCDNNCRLQTGMYGKAQPDGRTAVDVSELWTNVQQNKSKHCSSQRHFTICSILLTFSRYWQ